MAMRQPTLTAFSDWWPKVRDLPLLIPHTITIPVAFHEVVSWSHSTLATYDETIQRIRSLIPLRDSTPYFLCTDCDPLWPNSPGHSTPINPHHIPDHLKKISQHILEAGTTPSSLIFRESITPA